MRKKLKVAVVGCGYVAQQDYFPVLAHKDVKDCLEVTAVCDNVPGRAKEICQIYGFDQHYVDYDEMLKKTDMDLVVLLTPIPLHFNQAKKALQIRKHVYVQKTMTTTLEEAQQLIKLAKKNGVQLGASPGQMVDKYHQYSKNLIDEGKIGKVCFVRGQGPHPGHENQELFGIDPSWYYKPGGGPLMDVAVYPITSIVSLLGPAKRVSAFSGIANDDRHWDGKKLDVLFDDNAVLMLDFGEGVFASIHGNFVSRRVNTPQVELYGTKGVIQLGGWTREDVPLEIYTEDEILGSNAGWYRPLTSIDDQPESTRKPTVNDLLHMINAIIDNTTSIIDGAIAMHVIEIIEKCYESAQNGQAIPLDTRFEPVKLKDLP